MSKAKKDGADNFKFTLPQTRPRIAASDGNNIRNWRLFRGIESQGELAKLSITHDPKGVGVLRASICRLEMGQMRYNENHIEILAATLGCMPRDLIGTNPFDSGDIFAIYAGLDDAEKRRLQKMAASLKRS